jgi:hypothetical protein
MVLRVLVVAMTSNNPMFTAYPYNKKMETRYPDPEPTDQPTNRYTAYPC